jgi:thiosulfate dehydrogenase
MNVYWKENWPVYLIVLAVLGVISQQAIDAVAKKPMAQPVRQAPAYWVAPSLHVDATLQGDERKLVIYGQDLITHTALYFGPKGSIASITNGLNCQNCHLQAGAQPWGNNYGAVAATYPKFRDRSGSIETIPKRVNDCFERSLNGQTIDTNSREMKAIVAYITWLGQDVKTGEKPKGSGIVELAYLNRPASPTNGKDVYTLKCQSCHGVDGEGVLTISGLGYDYPPLWGEHSYNSGAGLFRLSRLAGYVRDNMPHKLASHQAPVLTDAEAWDVAAYINSQPRPTKDISHDWPDISKKPIDHPFGPYSDGFSEQQHKLGPFPPIIAARKAQKQKS